MGQLIEIKLGEHRPVGIFEDNNVACKRGEIVILEIEKTLEFGKVITDPSKPCMTKKAQILGKVLRLATDGDIRQIVNNQIKSNDARQSCSRKISDSTLDMQLVNTEYSFDSTKIMFFFTSEGRVDFRNLVKDLAKTFRARIELKQIGVRDKAKIVGGIGVCGRELCCSSYMKDFHPLSIKMAKDQGLPLNPSKISGVCGRVKCCMAYEFNVYKEMSKDLPKMGSKVTTESGDKGRVVNIDILKRFVTVDLGEGKSTKMTYPPIHVN